MDPMNETSYNITFSESDVALFKHSTLTLFFLLVSFIAIIAIVVLAKTLKTHRRLLADEMESTTEVDRELDQFATVN